MATDFRELEEFRDKIAALANGKSGEFCDECAEELAARLLAKAVRRTPVGNYEDAYELENDGEQKFLVMSGKVGGTLRKGWTTEPLERSGTQHKINVINPVPYASYVEYGHSQEPGRYVPAIDRKLKKSWVRGQFMMTDSAKEIKRKAPQIVQAKLNEFLNKELK